ncbi:MAG: DNA cytosine methyltransferase [Clostridiales bacterium]|jgi:DNA (cytosine-5)-methyltransferase 1|nr:DNA cytosine methyltransferase [Clostridiales bacterium]
MKFNQTPSGLLVPYYIVKKPKRPTGFGLFAGAGGFCLGMKMAGFEVVGANEYDTQAAITYMVNLGQYPMTIHYVEKGDKERLEKTLARMYGFKYDQSYRDNGLTKENLREAFGDDLAPKFTTTGSGWIKGKNIPGVRHFWLGDVCKLKGKDILDALGMKVGDLDVITGGPPCQGFSTAGKQRIDDPRNPLIYEMARLITELQPKTFVLENVPGLVNFFDPDGVPVIDKFCMLIQEGGYGKWEMIKKALLMQAGSASVIRGNAKVGGVKGPKKAKKAGVQKAAEGEAEQVSLF